MFGWLLRRLVKSFGSTGVVLNPNEGRVVTQGPRIAVARTPARRPVVRQEPRA